MAAGALLGMHATVPRKLNQPLTAPTGPFKRHVENEGINGSPSVRFRQVRTATLKHLWGTQAVNVCLVHHLSAVGGGTRYLVLAVQDVYLDVLLKARFAIKMRAGPLHGVVTFVFNRIANGVRAMCRHVFKAYVAVKPPKVKVSVFFLDHR